MPPPAGDAAAPVFRPHRAAAGAGSNGETQPLTGGLPLVSEGSGAGYGASRRSVTGGGMPFAMSRGFAPLLAVLVLAGGMLLIAGTWLHRSTAQLHLSTRESPERLSSTIAELSQNQAAMMQMLQKLSSAGGGAGGGGAAAGLAGAAAAAGAAGLAGKAAAGGAGGAGAAAAAGEATTAAFAAIPGLTKLHNTLLRRSHSYEEHRKAMLETLDALVHLEPEAAVAAIDSQLPGTPEDSAKRFTLQMYRLLLSTGKLIPCREDSTLKVNDPVPLRGGSHASSSSSSGSSGGHLHGHLHWSFPHHAHHAAAAASSTSSSSSSAAASTPRYYFATNLRDNTVNMPQFTLSLLQTLLRLPRSSAFVAAYESNSDDGAHGWVDVLQLALNVIGTPSHLVTRGGLVRLEGSNRIQHLARVRNMALTPLYQHYAAARSRRQASAAAGGGTNSSSAAATVGAAGRRSLLLDPSSSNSSSSSSNSSSRRLAADDPLAAMAASADAANLPPGVLPWDPDYVVFVNDAFFCWGMVHRLLNYRADITCGMDFWQNADATVELPGDLSNKQHLKKPAIPAEYKLERPIRKPLSPDQSNPIVFYDVWVARDLSGSKFWWNYPFVHDATTSAAAQKGLPFRASCCWNGLAVLKAAPFAAGLRIRPPMEGECQGSECTMVCDDFARLGFKEVVVDAGVQMTYVWELAREMLALGIEGFGQTTWAQAKAAGIAGADKAPAYERMECCGLKSRFTQWVNFHTDCYQDDVMATNFTHKVLFGSG